MLELTSNRWKTLRTGSGPATWVPPLLDSAPSIETDEQVDDFIMRLSELCHQWTTYDATYAATPHLLRICSSLPAHSPFRLRILSMMGWFAACLNLNDTRAPSDFVAAHEESLPAADRLTAESLQHSIPGREGIPATQLREVMAAYAAFREDYPLSFILYDLDTQSTQCASCGTFLDLFNSSLNPYFVENKDG